MKVSWDQNHKILPDKGADMRPGHSGCPKAFDASLRQENTSYSRRLPLPTLKRYWQFQTMSSKSIHLNSARRWWSGFRRRNVNSLGMIRKACTDSKVHRGDCALK